MLLAEMPQHEEIRIADLQLYNILDTPFEKEFDDLRQLAAQICNCPVALITLIDKDRQWFKSKQGTAMNGTSRELSFCSHAILGSDVMVVKDLSKDERFHDNPMVEGPSHLRFYAGAPIVSPTGQKLGTVCVLDHEPRQLTTEQESALEMLSAQVTRLLELRLKTKVIEQRASKLMSLKDQAVQEYIKEQDEENLLLAKELHENIAQELAAIRLYLDMAESNDSSKVNYIQSAREAIADVLTDIKNLSYSFSPSTLESSCFPLLLENQLQKMDHNGFHPNLHISGDYTEVGFLQSLNCVRIIETWLDVLYRQPTLSEVCVDVFITGEIHIIITDNAVVRSLVDSEKQLLGSVIYYRVIGMNGKLHYGTSASGLNELHIQLPVIRQEQEVMA